MKTTLIAVVAVTVVLGAAGHAQTMVEYSNLGTPTRVVKSTPAVTRAVDQATSTIAAAPGTAPASGKAHAPAPDPNAPQAVIWEAPETPGKKQPPAQPTPPAVFVLSNGDRVETARYMVTMNSVRVEQNGMQRTVPLSELNVDATVAANKARGLNIKFPTDKSQIMLGF
ncbi:MAG: hypothetical protein WBW69_04680 [Candidatus Korobacteraceae bacterium]